MAAKLFRKRWIGFTLIELMIVLGIIGILAAVAIPSYIGYLRRSYLNEATSSIAAIKSAEESYYTLNSCYIAVGAHPSTVPLGIAVDWDATSPPTGWGTNALSVRPDRHVRFQYQIFASTQVDLTNGGCGVAGIDPGAIGCVTDAVAAGAGGLVNTNFTPEWYIVVARGDLDGDGVSSNIVSAIDDSAIVMCNELE